MLPSRILDFPVEAFLWDDILALTGWASGWLWLRSETGKMQSWEVFMVCLVYLSLCSSVGIRSDDSNQKAQDFLDDKVKVVTRIADQATQNYNHTCDIVKTCGAKNCSRKECSTIDSLQQNDYSCVYVNNFTRCHNRTGSTCNLIKANFNIGMVSIPGTEPGTSESEHMQLLRTTICAQRELDSIFKDLYRTTKLKTSSTGFFYNLYFGSVDGAFRYYPGREHLSVDCDIFDHRIRSWYTAAISVLKDVVVILDTGSSMRNRGFLREETSLDIGKSMTTKLVQTLTTGDRVTVIPLRDSVSVQLVNISQSQYVVGSPDILNVTEVKGFVKDVLNDTTFSITPDENENLASNFTAGFLKALSIFNDSSSPSESLKIVILITDTRNTGPPADFAAAEILQDRAQLFVYDLSGNRSSGWARFAACQGTDSGKNQEIFGNTVVSNPLLSLNSYFSFLARSRTAANGGVPKHIWAKPYLDASHLGNVMTVSYPAMSSDGLELVGVAGIDIQSSGLDPDFESNIGAILSNPVSTAISRYQRGASTTSCSDSAGYLNKCSDYEPEPLCNSTSKAASDSELLKFVCCAECTSVRRTRRSTIFWVSGVLVVVFIILVCVAIHCFLKRFRNRQPTEDAMEPSLMRRYSFEALRQATNKLGSSNIVGRGQYGIVYKAYFGDVKVAVKELSQPADRAGDFKAELKILGLTSHPNLVELKGTCFQPTRCFLVYEFVENGDLSTWLWPEEGESERFLTWNQRIKIARGVACGLNYLHRELPKGKVFHLDIKPGNILLDANFNAKLADFGISQLYEPGYTFKVDSVIAGTFGYLAPEVLRGQVRPNSKIDVYSYGMVLLQLMSGRKIDDPLVHPGLLQWARDQVQDGDFERVVDEYLIEAVQEDYRWTLMENCELMIRLALRCLSERSELRPEMPQVLDVIDSLGDVVDLESMSKSIRSLACLSTGVSFKFRSPKSSGGKSEKSTDKTISLSGPLHAYAETYERLHYSRSNNSLHSSMSLPRHSVELPSKTAGDFNMSENTNPQSLKRTFSG